MPVGPCGHFRLVVIFIVIYAVGAAITKSIRHGFCKIAHGERIVVPIYVEAYFPFAVTSRGQGIVGRVLFVAHHHEAAVGFGIACVVICQFDEVAIIRVGEKIIKRGIFGGYAPTAVCRNT